MPDQPVPVTAAILSGAPLSHATLSRATLSRAPLSHAPLSRAILRHATLRPVLLSHATLRPVLLSHATLSRTITSRTVTSRNAPGPGPLAPVPLSLAAASTRAPGHIVPGRIDPAPTRTLGSLGTRRVRRVHRRNLTGDRRGNLSTPGNRDRTSSFTGDRRSRVDRNVFDAGLLPRLATLRTLRQTGRRTGQPLTDHPVGGDVEQLAVGVDDHPRRGQQRVTGTTRAGTGRTLTPPQHAKATGETVAGPGL
ncbi:pentapeptide repeat-containing protein [Kineosporia succinea]|uniref:pentapeptide repeat-containing protein n=1 Tax=Kineosporia succinea TaxID=84632 RepID=UPI003520DB93